MKHSLIAPVSVGGHEPTCLSAFLVMAHDAALPCSPERARQLLSSAGVAWEGPADAWSEGLARSLTILTHGEGGRTHAR